MCCCSSCDVCVFKGGEQAIISLVPSFFVSNYFCRLYLKECWGMSSIRLDCVYLYLCVCLSLSVFCLPFKVFRCLFNYLLTTIDYYYYYHLNWSSSLYICDARFGCKCLEIILMIIINTILLLLSNTSSIDSFYIYFYTLFTALILWHILSLETFLST